VGVGQNYCQNHSRPASVLPFAWVAMEVKLQGRRRVLVRNIYPIATSQSTCQTPKISLLPPSSPTRLTLVD